MSKNKSTRRPEVDKQLTIELYGDRYELKIENDEFILDAALRNNIDAPYACMSGTCHSCQATLLEGEVIMEEAEALSEDEIKAGQILTCCSRAKTQSLKIKYPD